MERSLKIISALCVLACSNLYAQTTGSSPQQNSGVHDYKSNGVIRNSGIGTKPTNPENVMAPSFQPGVQTPPTGIVQNDPTSTLLNNPNGTGLNGRFNNSKSQNDSLLRFNNSNSQKTLNNNYGTNPDSPRVIKSNSVRDTTR